MFNMYHQPCKVCIQQTGRTIHVLYLLFVGFQKAGCGSCRGHLENMKNPIHVSYKWKGIKDGISNWNFLSWFSKVDTKGVAQHFFNLEMWPALFPQTWNIWAGFPRPFPVWQRWLRWGAFGWTTWEILSLNIRERLIITCPRLLNLSLRSWKFGVRDL